MKHIRYTIAAVLALSTLLVFSAAPPTQAGNPLNESGFRAVAGISYIDTGYEYSHNTHPADAFLPNSGVPGSAGTTKVDNDFAVKLGIGYEWRFKPRLSLSLDAGGLISVWSRDRHKNDNDSRPGENASFVYSQANLPGFFGELGINYDINNRLFVGASGGVAGIWIESGWDRWGSDESASSTTKIIPMCDCSLFCQLKGV